MTIDKVRRITYNFINGIHSGIPLCCVLYYCKESITTISVAADVYERRYKLPWDTSSDNDIKLFGVVVQYVMCDKCATDKKVVSLKLNGSICNWLLPKKIKKRL
jgi:hypothetical protein